MDDGDDNDDDVFNKTITITTTTIYLGANGDRKDQQQAIGTTREMRLCGDPRNSKTSRHIHNPVIMNKNNNNNNNSS